jgi:hypothetical protein
MTYFAQHVQDKRPDEIVEIDVHCDVQVFEWLMAYISQKEVTLEPRTVISILISSHFLKMSSLETHCLSFIHKNINQVVQGKSGSSSFAASHSLQIQSSN